MLEKLIQFFPKTKAKSSEVNYNFDLVKQSVDELNTWKSEIDTKVTSNLGFNLFDTKVVDHILTDDAARGWMLQGSLVTKTYISAVDAIKKYYEEGIDTTYRGIDCKLASNKMYIADIGKKADIDKLFEETGVADFYIVDRLNEQFYLPRSKWFHQFTLDTSVVNNYVEPGIPDHWHYVDDMPDTVNRPRGDDRTNCTTYYQTKKTRMASECNPIYGASESVQPPSSLKLLYYKVGDTYVNIDSMLIDAETILDEKIQEINTAGTTAVDSVKNQGQQEVQAVATQGEESAQLSKDWAIKTDGMVNDEDYSSKYYANKAKEVIPVGGDAGQVLAKRTNSDYDYMWTSVEGGLGGGSGYPLLHIGISLFVNESLGLDRYLNGQLVAINDNYKPALAELKKLKSTSPSLFTTEENWQAEKLLSHYGQVGKFVIADDESTLRLPAIVNIQGLFDLQNLGLRVDAGLPNVTGKVTGFDYSGTGETGYTSGAFRTSSRSAGSSASGGTNIARVSFNASLSSPIYKDDCETVQIEAIQYPFFIRLATGQETEVNIVNEIELNNPYSLLESKYSETKLNNASWLRSEGQENSKAVYVTAYEALQVEYNSEIEEGQTVELPSGSSYTKRGLSVKLSSEEYTDYDFVLNTSNETFRLPLKSNLASSNFAKGNGKTLGMTNGSSDFVFRSSDVSQYLGKYTDTLGASTQIETVTPYGQAIGVSTDSTKSGIELDTEKVYLYYYVGETVQNANLINAGRIEEKLVDKLELSCNNASAQTKEFMAHQAMPSDRYEVLTAAGSASTYTAPADGYYFLSCKSSTASKGWISLVNTNINNFGIKSAVADGPFTAFCYMPCKKGDIVQIGYSDTSITKFMFIYAQGVSND